MQKRKIIASYQKLQPEVLQMVQMSYPNGFDFALQRITVPGSNVQFYAFPVETETASYLIKVPVETDEESDSTDSSDSWDDEEDEEHIDDDLTDEID